MAKKVVATLKKKDGSAMYTKVVRMVKTAGSNSYSFEERTIPKDAAGGFFKS